MERVVLSIGDWLKDIFSNANAMGSGALATILGYFLPIRDSVNLLIVFFVVDSIIGYLKNRKLNNEKFSKRKVFETTIPRMMAVITFMMLLFALDSTYKQNFVETYMIVGYFVGGVLLYNIWKNLYALTKWKAFLHIGDMLKKNVKEKTGMDIQKPEIKESNDTSN